MVLRTLLLIGHSSPHLSGTPPQRLTSLLPALPNSLNLLAVLVQMFQNHRCQDQNSGVLFRELAKVKYADYLYN